MPLCKAAGGVAGRGLEEERRRRQQLTAAILAQRLNAPAGRGPMPMQRPLRLSMAAGHASAVPKIRRGAGLALSHGLGLRLWSGDGVWSNESAIGDPVGSVHCTVR
jgi:hypothetical protein